MAETPYRVASRVARNADDLDLHDLAENVVDAVLALPNVVVLHDADTEKGMQQVEQVARTLMNEQCNGCVVWEDEDEKLRGHLLDHSRAVLHTLRTGEIAP